MRPFKIKQRTFEQQHNISLTKQTYSKDPLDLDYTNWAYLYQSMKARGLNQKQIRKNVMKYQQTAINIVQNTQSSVFDKSRTTMRQKIVQLNHQLKIRLGQIFQFISMLHMQQLQQMVQLVYNSFMSTIQKLIDIFQQSKDSFMRIQRQLQNWKLKKKNVLCFSCNKHLEETKFRELSSEIGSTTIAGGDDGYNNGGFVDNQHRVQKITSQCKSLQIQIQQLSEANFFNSESDNLIQRINQLMKQRVVETERHQQQQPRQSTSQMLIACLGEMNQVLKQLQVQFSKEQVAKSVRKLKSSKVFDYDNQLPLIEDLTNTQAFTNKLMKLFSTPIKNFITKYQQLLMKKSNNIDQQQQQQQQQVAKTITATGVKQETESRQRAKVQFTDQETQTSLIKQPQLIKNLQKQLASLTKQINLVRSSKQKGDKEMMAMYDKIKQSQLKVIETISQNKLIQQTNKELQSQLVQLKKTLKNNQQTFSWQKELIFKSFTEEKLSLTKEIAQLLQKVQNMQEEFKEKMYNRKLETKATQTYKVSMHHYHLNSLQSKQQQLMVQQKCTQTQQQALNNNKNQQPYFYPKSQQKTIRSLKIKNDSHSHKASDNQLRTANISLVPFSTKMGNHFKSRSEIPLDDIHGNNNNMKNMSCQFSMTARNFNHYHHQQKQYDNLISSPTSNHFPKTFKQGNLMVKNQNSSLSPFETPNLNLTGHSISKKVLFNLKSQKRPSINNLVHQVVQTNNNSKNTTKCIISLNKMINQNDEMQFNLQGERDNCGHIFNSGQKQSMLLFHHNNTTKSKKLLSKQMIRGSSYNDLFMHKRAFSGEPFVMGSRQRLHYRQHAHQGQYYQHQQLQDEQRNNQANQSQHQHRQRIVMVNNSLSGLLTQNKQIDQLMASTLKKKSKQQIKKQHKSATAKNNHKPMKKVMIRSSLQSPIYEERVEDLIKVNKLQNNKYSSLKHQSSWRQQSRIQQSTSQQQQQMSTEGKQDIKQDKTPSDNSKKQKILSIIEENFGYFEEIGLVQFIEENKLNNSHSNNQRYQSINYSSGVNDNNTISPSSLSQLQLRDILHQNQAQLHAQHIKRVDLQLLFFTHQQASKYENRIGMWNQIQSCIMVDNNFSKLINQIDKFFTYLKLNKKSCFNQYALFLAYPSKFVKDMMDEKNHNVQKQKVLKEFVRLHKMTSAVMNKKSFIKQTFKKLLKSHKIMHKNGCNHVEKFLQKIGFQEYRIKNDSLTINKQQPQLSEFKEIKSLRNSGSMPKGLKL